ncbi:MAG: transposase [Acidobacteriota bacterium]|nr:transposase [Acidobacteriota bacterium]
MGCAHFRTDPSYIPELQNYLDELLLARERLLAAGDDVIEPWARHSAMPAPEEVERVRHLIRRCQSEMDALTQDERREIERCVSVLRTGRAQLGEAVPVKLGRKIRSDAPDLFPGTDRRAPGATGFAR